MYDYVDCPPKYGRGFTLLCFSFIVSHILTDSCEFFTHIPLCCFAGSIGYTNHGIFPTFSSQIAHKNIVISEANSGTYANIDQGFILNMLKLGLNRHQ